MKFVSMEAQNSNIVAAILNNRKIDFADLVKDARSVAGFSPLMTSHKHGLAAKTLSNAASEVASLQTNFFRIVGTSEAETYAECLLAIGEDKKVSFLE